MHTTPPPTTLDALNEVLSVYRGSNGDETRTFYLKLEGLGPAGVVAMNLFRAEKCSTRAKVYRRGAHKREAYQRKQWSMDNLCAALLKHGDELGLAWGWKHDPKQEFHNQVLYVCTGFGQASFHTAARGQGPDFEGEWDGIQGGSVDAVIRYAAMVLTQHIIPS